MTILNNFKDLNNVDLSNIRLVMWDMDGTITNTEALHAECIYSMFRAPTFTQEEFEQKTCGQADEQVFEQYSSFLSTSTLQEFIEHKNQKLCSLLNENKHKIVDTNVVSYIKELQAKGMPCALVTSSQRDIMNFILEVLDIQDLFKFKRAYEDNTYNKPKPDPYLSTLKQANVSARDAIIFEDSVNGLTAARAANVKEVYQVKWYR